MTPPDFTVSRIGQINAGGAVDAIFLKVFAGEVLTAFTRKNKALGNHLIRSISSGKSAQFPAMGRVGTSYHTPGVTIDGSVINHAEEVVTIDGNAIATTFISNIDEAMNHYDVRAPYSGEMGKALATLMDTNMLRMGVIGAATATPTVTGLPGGTVLTYDATAPDAVELLVSQMFTAAQTLDQNDADEEDRFAYVKPSTYYSFINATSKLINRDYTGGDNGGVDTGVILRIAGIKQVKTNNLPVVDDSANGAIPTQYRANFLKNVALIAQRASIGTVKLIDLGLESEYVVRNQGTFMVAKYACGHKWLRQASLVQIKTL